MVEFTSDIRPGIFVRRPANISNFAARSSRNAIGAGREDAYVRPRSASSVDLSEGARQALRGSERALELARDFNADRLGRPARRRLGEFFRGFSRDLGASERDIDRTARRVGRLTEDLDRRFGDLADRLFGRLDRDFGASAQSTAFSFSQFSFSLQVDTTILAIIEDGDESLVRLDQVQLSLQAVQINGSVSIREGFGISPKTPLFELPEGRTAADFADRLIEVFGTSTVTTQLEAQKIALDLSTTVFRADGAGNVTGPAEEETGEGGAIREGDLESNSEVSVVA